jgi:hypothetical protein
MGNSPRRDWSGAIVLRGRRVGAAFRNGSRAPPHHAQSPSSKSVTRARGGAVPPAGQEPSRRRRRRWPPIMRMPSFCPFPRPYEGRMARCCGVGRGPYEQGVEQGHWCYWSSGYGPGRTCRPPWGPCWPCPPSGSRLLADGAGPAGRRVTPVRGRRTARVRRRARPPSRASLRTSEGPPRPEGRQQRHAGRPGTPKPERRRPGSSPCQGTPSPSPRRSGPPIASGSKLWGKACGQPDS